MALRRTACQALGCNGCQSWVLRLFIASVSGLSTTPTVVAPRQQRRTISQTPNLWDEAQERIQKERDMLNASDQTEGAAEGESIPQNLQHSDTQPLEPQTLQPDSIPWYLQPQEPITYREPESLAARQQLPPLPDHSPDLLQPLLNHLSVELGMDNLTLLDLRTLDPPPALGANLVMLLGTARSEKHLHISADKLCRWLRTEYKLRPYADGLLGRNELKLKMRRTAKRSRLLSAVGAKPTGETEIDDGIRTGWVCVNIGRVEGGELPENVEKVQRAEGVVGFGARTEGCSIVVQMLTEEKREELDLERLWGDMMKRAKREKDAARVVESYSGTEQSAQTAVREEEVVDAAMPPIDQISPSIGQQARAFGSAT